MTSWRCSECGCSREAAERKRKRLGLLFQFLTIRAVTCSPKCGCARAHRLWRAKYDRHYWRRIRARRRKRAKRREGPQEDKQMRWLSLIGQVLGAAGAICTVVSPFVRSQAVAVVKHGVAHDFPGGVAPPWRQLLAQSRWTIGGLALIALGFLLQAAGT